MSSDDRPRNEPADSASGARAGGGKGRHRRKRGKLSPLAKRQLTQVRGRLRQDRPRLLVAGNHVITSYKSGRATNSAAIVAALGAMRADYQKLRADILAEHVTTSAAIEARALTAKVLADYEAVLSALEAAAQANPNAAAAHLHAASQHLSQARSARQQATAMLGGAWPL